MSCSHAGSSPSQSTVDRFIQSLQFVINSKTDALSVEIAEIMKEIGTEANATIVAEAVVADAETATEAVMADAETTAGAVMAALAIVAVTSSTIVVELAAEAANRRAKFVMVLVAMHIVKVIAVI